MDIIRNLYLHKYSHKMFYKTKSNSNSRRTSTGDTTGATSDGLRSQQFYIYTIDGRPAGRNTMPDVHHDLPPKYEDVIKDPNYVRREAS